MRLGTDPGFLIGDNWSIYYSGRANSDSSSLPLELLLFSAIFLYFFFLSRHNLMR